MSCLITWKWNPTESQQELFNEWKLVCISYLETWLQGFDIESFSVRMDKDAHTGPLPLRKMGFPSVHHFLYEMRESLEIRTMDEKPFVFIRKSKISSDDGQMRELSEKETRGRVYKTKSGEIDLPTRNQTTYISSEQAFLKYAPKYFKLITEPSKPAPSSTAYRHIVTSGTLLAPATKSEPAKSNLQQPEKAMPTKTSENANSNSTQAVSTTPSHYAVSTSPTHQATENYPLKTTPRSTCNTRTGPRIDIQRNSGYTLDVLYTMDAGSFCTSVRGRPSRMFSESITLEFPSVLRGGLHSKTNISLKAFLDLCKGCGH